MKFLNRDIVFNTGIGISKKLGGIAQNEFEIRETDIIVEFQNVDRIIDELQEYKKLIVAQINHLS